MGVVAIILGTVGIPIILALIPIYMELDALAKKIKIEEERKKHGKR